VVPFSDPQVGAATCLYVSTKESTFLEELQSISMTSDFFAGVMTAWQLDSANFTLSQTIVTTAQEHFRIWRLSSHRKPACGRPLHRAPRAEQGLEVRLLPYVVQTVADFKSLQ